MHESFNSLISEEKFRQADKVAKSLIASTTNLDELSDLLFQLGVMSMNFCLDTKAESYFLKAKQLASRGSITIPRCHHQLALLYCNQAKLSQADDEISLGLDAISGSECEDLICRFELSIARVENHLREDLPEARLELLRLTQLFDSNTSTLFKQSCILVLLKTMYKLERLSGNLEIQRDIALKAEQVCLDLGKEGSLVHADILIQLAESFVASPEKSLEYLLLSKNIFIRKTGFSRGKTKWLLEQIGNRYELLGKLGQASRCYRQILRIERRSGQTNMTPETIARLKNIDIGANLEQL